MTAVNEGIRDIHRPLYLNEAMFFERLHTRVLGQDDALKALAAVMVRHFARRRPARPAVVFAVGPSGDAGRLSTASRSSDGHQIDCRHAVFMFTSNLDAKSILDELETRNAFGNRTVEDDVCRRRLHAAGVAPEIVGRIGRFLVYRPLSPETRAEIVALAVAEVADEYGLRVSYVEPSVIVELMQKSRSQSFGVRPERFLIDDVLGGAFANAAEQGVTDSVVVVGPPFECKPHSADQPPHDQQESENGDEKENLD